MFVVDNGRLSIGMVKHGALAMLKSFYKKKINVCAHKVCLFANLLRDSRVTIASGEHSFRRIALIKKSLGLLSFTRKAIKSYDSSIEHKLERLIDYEVY